HREEDRRGDSTAAERHPHQGLDAPLGHVVTSHQMKAETTASAAYSPPMMRGAGTGLPRSRGAIACGVTMNHVTVWRTRKAKPTTLITTITGEAARSRKCWYSVLPWVIARTSSSR